MSTKVRWIKPKRLSMPKADIVLQASDLIPDWMDFVWVLPGNLDEGELCNALAQTLQDYYHVVGRLNFSDASGQWSLVFNENENAGIPVTFGTTTRPSIMSDGFDHERHPDYVDQHPFVLDRSSPSATEPLLTLKVVESNGETTLTLGWCHVLGDCTSMTHWANSLSLYYQGMKPTFMPTFEKYYEPDAMVDEHVVPQVLPLLYHQEYAIQNSTLHTTYNKMLSTTSRVSVRISAFDLRAVHTWVNGNTKAVSRISEADAAVGLLGACIAAVSPVNVERVVYIMGTRGFHPSLSSTTMGNCMQSIATEEMGGNANPWDFADALRSSMTFSRNPENLGRILALHSQLLRRPDLTPDYINLHSPDRMVYVNALHKIPVLGVDFGYTDRVRFYLYGSGEHFLSILPANPALEEDGTWITNTGGIDVVFRLKHDRVDGFWRNFYELIQAAQTAKTEMGMQRR